MHATLHALVKLCADPSPACSPDSIDALISLIGPNLDEIMACACKHIGYMHTSLPAQGEVCTRKGQACPPESIDT